MFLVLDIKSLFELTWEDIPYIESPVFAIEHVKDAIGGAQDYWSARVTNIHEFAHTHSLQRYSHTLYNAEIESSLRFLFSTGSYFSVARNKIPFAASFGWRELDNHPDGGEWYISHYNYADGVKQKLEAHAKYLGVKRRRMLAEQAEDDAEALISAAKRVAEKRGKVDTYDAGQIDVPRDNPAIGGMASQNKSPAQEQIELAKSVGNTSSHIEARESVARTFLENNGFTKDQIEDALGAYDGTKKGGIDLSMPVEVITFPPPEKMAQYVKSHGYPGNWFDPLSSQTPEMLGISGETRTQKIFNVVPSTGLKSIAKSVIDDWTNPKNPILASGGGVQVLVNDETKNMISKINLKGI